MTNLKQKIINAFTENNNEFENVLTSMELSGQINSYINDELGIWAQQGNVRIFEKNGKLKVYRRAGENSDGFVDILEETYFI